jgi:hypothetical protein
MASNPTVVFSANIKDLIGATNEVKSAIESISETASKASSILKGFGELAVAGLSVEGIKSFIESQGQLAEQVERTGAILGVSTTAVQELNLIEKATGGESGSLAMAMERLQVNLAKAATGAGPTAAALKVLGINAKSLIGIPIDQQMRKIADAFAKFADGPNKAAVAMELFGRAGAQMIPVLDQGRIGLELLRQTADYIAISPENIESWAKLGRSTTTLKEALSNLAGTLTGEFTSGLTTATNKMVGFIGSINSAANAGTLWERTLNLIKTAAVQMAAAEDITGGGKGIVSAANAQLAAERLELVRKTGTTMLTDLMGHANTTKKSFQEMWDTMLGTGGKKPQMPSMDLGNGKDAQKAQITQIEAVVQEAQRAYEIQVQQINELAKTHQITEQQKTEMLKEAISEREIAQLGELQHGEQLLGLSKTQYQKFADDIEKYGQKGALDLTKVNAQAAEEYTKEWTSALTAVQSAFDSQLKGLLAGTTSWAVAMKHIFGDLVMDVIKVFEKMAVEKAASGLADLTKTGPMSALSGAFGGLFGGGAKAASGAGQEATTTANTTAIGALTTALGLNTAALTGETTATTAETATSGTAAAGGIGSALATMLATMFAPLKAMFGFAAGTDRIMNTGIAMVHKGETIVPPPAQGNGRFTGAGLGGDAPTVNFHIHAIDTQSGADFIDKNIRPIARKLQDHWRSNSGDRPKGW